MLCPPFGGGYTGVYVIGTWAVLEAGGSRSRLKDREFRYSSLVQNIISRLFFAHAACFYTGIFFQIVIPNRMVEDCTQLILNGLEINRRVGSSVLIAIVDQFILLADHLLNNSLFYGRLGVLGYPLNKQVLGTQNPMLAGTLTFT